MTNLCNKLKTNSSPLALEAILELENTTIELLMDSMLLLRRYM
jgi:hypothetical protein